MLRGMVIKTTGSRHLVRIDGVGVLSCTIKGRFRIQGIRLTNPVAVGDQVVVIPGQDQDTGIITEILPRKNYIIRKSINLSKEAHILAANLDLALVMVTLRDPVTMSMFVDRFLVSAEAYKIPAGLIFNKLDLYTDEDFDKMGEWSAAYEDAGYAVYHLSVKKNIGIEQLQADLCDKITLISGNSGVGKSSLINRLVPGQDLRIGEISEAHKAGIHTTTYAEMLLLNEGGYVIDTPGIKGFGTIDIRKDELYHFFPEIFRLSSACRYHNCTHSHEPGCAVLTAVEQGDLSYMRYTNYLNMLSENDEKYRTTPW